jgi:hypothetical protein
MTRPPTRADRAAAAAWLNAQARIIRRAEAAAHLILALVIAVLCAVALVHWFTPCEREAALCLVPALALPRRAGQRLRRLCRRLHIRWLQVRLAQLQGTAQQMALDAARQDHQGAAGLGPVLDRAAAVRLQLHHLQQADRRDRLLATRGWAA